MRTPPAKDSVRTPVIGLTGILNDLSDENGGEQE